MFTNFWFSAVVFFCFTFCKKESVVCAILLKIGLISRYNFESVSDFSFGKAKLSLPFSSAFWFFFQSSKTSFKCEVFLAVAQTEQALTAMVFYFRMAALEPLPANA